MKVFNACLIVIKRRYATFVIYFAIFMALLVVITALTSVQSDDGFTGVRPNFTVINRDADTILISGLISFLSDNGNEIALDDNRSALQDATFNRATDYILFIPHGFSESFLSGAVPVLETVKTIESARGFYADSLVNQYLNMARVYIAAGSGMGEDELVAAVLSDLALEAVAEKRQFGSSVPLESGYRMYNQMMCYIMLVLVILCVTNITMVFRRPDLRMRNMCAPLKPRIMSGQQILVGIIMSIFAWLLMSIIGLLMFGRSLEGTDSRAIALILLNSLIFTLVAMAVAALSGSFVRSANSQNAVANILTLGLCFLGGVFVPLSLLGDGLLAVARFLPTYWNVSALEHIGTLTSFSPETLQPVRQAMLMQLAFAAAIFCVTLVLGKYLSQSERFLSSTRTEFE